MRFLLLQMCAFALQRARKREVIVAQSSTPRMMLLIVVDRFCQQFSSDPPCIQVIIVAYVESWEP